ncbi:hypothetical protein EDB81DRAFT_884983 [Dactylonectria macrodidyma]|uniref:Uncharacterized protein n=1 Tax=Dactylonectria macrodidyma TaxID=307937 RepID=A0A9P9ERQ7_9HYPO|nr:hypothetical protein EDB81DRAFT_884983 [Dactylonectria macrodidyma]
MNDSDYSSSTALTPHRSKSDAAKGRFAVTVNPRPPLQIIDKPIPDSLYGRFIDFKKLCTEAIWKAISSRLHRNPGDISMKLRYMGENEQDTRQYIVVQCKKRVSRKIKKFFDEPGVKEALGHGFQVHFIDSDLIRLTDTQTVMVYGQEQSWPNRERSICATTIDLVLGNESRRAALGGMIVVKMATEKLFYGLTAEHPLASLCPDISDDASDQSDDQMDSEDDASDEDYVPIQVAASTEDSLFTEIDNTRDMIVVGQVAADSFRSSKDDAN